VTGTLNDAVDDDDDDEKTLLLLLLLLLLEEEDVDEEEDDWSPVPGVKDVVLGLKAMGVSGAASRRRAPHSLTPSCSVSYEAENLTLSHNISVHIYESANGRADLIPHGGSGKLRERDATDMLCVISFQ